MPHIMDRMEGDDSDYSMEGASDSDVDERFAHLVEASLKGATDGQMSIDEEQVLSSSLLVEQEHKSR